MSEKEQNDLFAAFTVYAYHSYERDSRKDEMTKRAMALYLWLSSDKFRKPEDEEDLKALKNDYDLTEFDGKIPPLNKGLIQKLGVIIKEKPAPLNSDIRLSEIAEKYKMSEMKYVDERLKILEYTQDEETISLKTIYNEITTNSNVAEEKQQEGSEIPGLIKKILEMEGHAEIALTPMMGQSIPPLGDTFRVAGNNIRQIVQGAKDVLPNVVRGVKDVAPKVVGAVATTGAAIKTVGTGAAAMGKTVAAVASAPYTIPAVIVAGTPFFIYYQDKEIRRKMERRLNRPEVKIRRPSSGTTPLPSNFISERDYTKPGDLSTHDIRCFDEARKDEYGTYHWTMPAIKRPDNKKNAPTVDNLLTQLYVLETKGRTTEELPYPDKFQTPEQIKEYLNKYAPGSLDMYNTALETLQKKAILPLPDLEARLFYKAEYTSMDYMPPPVDPEKEKRAKFLIQQLYHLENKTGQHDTTFPKLQTVEAVREELQTDTYYNDILMRYDTEKIEMYGENAPTAENFKRTVQDELNKHSIEDGVPPIVDARGARLNEEGHVVGALIEGAIPDDLNVRRAILTYCDPTTPKEDKEAIARRLFLQAPDLVSSNPQATEFNGNVADARQYTLDRGDDKYRPLVAYDEKQKEQWLALADRYGFDCPQIVLAEDYKKLIESGEAFTGFNTDRLDAIAQTIALHQKTDYEALYGSYFDDYEAQMWATEREHRSTDFTTAATLHDDIKHAGDERAKLKTASGVYAAEVVDLYVDAYKAGCRSPEQIQQYFKEHPLKPIVTVRFGDEKVPPIAAEQQPVPRTSTMKKTLGKKEVPEGKPQAKAPVRAPNPPTRVNE